MHHETACQVGTLLTLLEGSLKAAGDALAASAAVSAAEAAAHAERKFLFCLAWSLGGLLHERDRPAFDAELRTLAQPAVLPPKVIPYLS
jgi:dynein heavy chain